MYIFLSRPTWTALKFEAGIKNFLTHLENLELIPRTLGVSDYPNKSPLDEVIDLLEECSGAIILGAPQIEIHSGTLKGENIEKSITLGTEWNHLEAGLAYASGLPLLVIRHKTVSRGIFDRGVLNAFVHEVNLSDQDWSMQPRLNGALKHWKEQCVKGASNFRPKERAVPGPRDNEICPNCSTSSKSIYLRPVSADFQHIVGGNWECPICKWVLKSKG